MERQRILVVDDEKNIRLTLVQALESAGMLVQTAGDGEEALRLLSEADFNLVLLDLKLPGMDGLEVLRRIRQSRPKLRVIIITAHGTIEYAVEAMKSGAVAQAVGCQLEIKLVPKPGKKPISLGKRQATG